MVIIETGRGSVKADSLASNDLIVACSLSVLLPDVRVLDARHLVFYTKDGILVIDMLALLTLRHNLLPLAALAAQNADAVVPPMVLQVESVSC